LLKKMSDAKVLASVVTDEHVGVIGFVDVLDILVCVLELTSNSIDITTERIGNLKWEGQCFSRQKSGVISNISQSDPLVTVSSTTSLYDVVKTFAKEVHRMAVMDNGVLKNVISQFDIVSFIATRGIYIGTSMSMSLIQTGLMPLGVVTVREDVNVVKAIKEMQNYKLSGVAVVDKRGFLIANFSATDLLGLTEENFYLLSLPVIDFIKRIYGFPKPPVFVTAADTVENVLLKIVVHEVHRIYIVDERMTPLGVITLTDIMQWLLAAGDSMSGFGTTTTPKTQKLADMAL